MLNVSLRGIPQNKLMAALQGLTRSNLKRAFAQARHYVPAAKKEIHPHQAALLHILTSAIVPSGGTILEIGTNRGFSAAVMALAAPEAYVLTLEPNPDLAALAAEQLEGLTNAHVINMLSWDYLKLPRKAYGPDYDLIFVDGDHNRIAQDMPWFNRVRVGGLFLCDDYSPVGSANPSPIVYAVLNEFTERLGRGFDVLMVDERGNGTAGWYRRGAEQWG